jgi:cytochrome P450
MISRYADIEPAMSDWRTFSSARGVLVGTDSSQLPTNMFNMDPPRHDQLRSVLSRVLTPTRVAGLEPFVRELARGLIAKFRDEGKADVTTQYAQVIPSTVVGELMGLNGADREKFLQWNLATVGTQDFVGPEALEAYAEMDGYWRETITSRRGERTDDVVSEIFHAQVEGENLTDEEIYGFCSLILPASQHTTINMMSNAVITLARYPDQRRMLRENPDLWPDAMEELIRYESPVQGLARTAMRDVELHGVTIPEGEWVLMLFGSANHDETVYENPDRLDITRKGARPHYSFGHGIHYCLGNAVARLQTRVALQELVETLGDWDVDESGVVRNQLVPGRGVAHVPVTFDAA